MKEYSDIPQSSSEQISAYEKEKACRTKSFEQQGVIPVGTPVKYMIGAIQYEGIIISQSSELTSFGEPLYMVGQQNRNFGIPRYQSELVVIHAGVDRTVS